MKRMITLIAAAFALVACATSSAPNGGSGALEVAPLQYTMRTLSNGLRVYSMPDANTANVSVQVWYDVGSVDDPAGRSGFAHLFEHIMFKATRNMPSETFDRLKSSPRTTSAAYCGRKRIAWARSSSTKRPSIPSATL